MRSRGLRALSSCLAADAQCRTGSFNALAPSCVRHSAPAAALCLAEHSIVRCWRSSFQALSCKHASRLVPASNVVLGIVVRVQSARCWGGWLAPVITTLTTAALSKRETHGVAMSQAVPALCIPTRCAP